MKRRSSNGSEKKRRSRCIEGTIKRSGYFDRGKQVGEWTTYDKEGKVVKITKMG